jgi:heme/copper-type cytochrome/quinol oxidase subunit 2
VGRLYSWLILGVFSFACPGWILFGAWSVTTIYNKNNDLQQKQQHTQQSRGWGIFIIRSLLVFLLLLVLVVFCFGALSVATNNNNLHQSTTKTAIYNKNNSTHNNQHNIQQKQQ